jgi:hypothetical protein
MYLWGQRSASNLGAYRGPYVLRGLADDTVSVPVDPNMMLYAGLGLLAVAAILFTGKKAAGSVRSYRRKRIQRKRKKLQQQLFTLGGS